MSPREEHPGFTPVARRNLLPAGVTAQRPPGAGRLVLRVCSLLPGKHSPLEDRGLAFGGRSEPQEALIGKSYIEGAALLEERGHLLD